MVINKQLKKVPSSLKISLLIKYINTKNIQPDMTNGNLKVNKLIPNNL